MPAAPCHLHFKKAPLGGFVFLLFSVCFFSQSWATYTRLLFLFLRVLYPVVSRIVLWQQLHGPGAPPGARGYTMGRPDPDFSGSLSPVPFHLRHTWVPIRILPRSWGSCLPAKLWRWAQAPAFPSRWPVSRDQRLWVSFHGYPAPPMGTVTSHLAAAPRFCCLDSKWISGTVYARVSFSRGGSKNVVKYK